MGTYADSKIVKARKVYNCGALGCRAEIKKGDEYLRYKAGLFSDRTICLDCALFTGWWSPAGRRPVTSDPASRRYDCAAVRERAGDAPSLVRQATERR